MPTALLKSGPAKTFLALFGIWTLIVACILGAELYSSYQEDREIALNRAMDSYHKDMAYRRWASERGGVYVPADARTPTNPHLAHRPDRDVTTTEGKKLTLVNPAYMTRMVHELGSEAYGLKGHLTSLKPIRPENAPDPWERKALEAFERGAREYSEILREEGKTILRFMGAFLVEPSCLSCHGHQGYKLGEVRGGISVTVPVGPFIPVPGWSHKTISLVTILAFWIMGGFGVNLWVDRLTSSARQHHRMLKKLELSSRRFRLLFESSPAPMAIHQAGRMVIANEAAARLLGATNSEALIGLKLLDLVHPDYRSFVEERALAAFRTGLPTPPAEEIFLTLQGESKWVEVQTVPIEFSGGPAILVFAQDLTERRRVEEERHKMETEIQHTQKLESLGSLAGGIAHDMNNVLSAVLGMSSLLQIKHPEDATLVKSLQIIEGAASRGRDLVKGLTNFARKGLEEPQAMDLNALIRQEVDLLLRTTRHRFTFDVQLAEGLPSILGEPSSLGSAFMNLCVNAFDAMPHGGTLRVRTTQEVDHVALQVEDTGEGIPPEILTRVTEPFFTTKPTGRGTGLGLAMVYGTVKAHGGSLDIESEVGKGTCVTLRFPIEITGVQVGATASTEPQPRDPSLRVLVVDDDELIRSILPDMLIQLGHQVDTASSGLEALRRLEAGLEPDLVILDHNMPGMSGGETLPRILRLRPEARVFIATGFQDTDLKILLADFPDVLTLQKPFSLAELQRAIRNASVLPRG